MADYIRKNKSWWTAWLVIWAVVFLVALLIYPSDPSYWGGWLPSSVFYTFGLMVVTFVLGWVFSAGRYKSDGSSN